MNPPDSVPPLPAVHTVGLTRTYGAMTALNSLDLTINRGDLFGFIGSNGRGKTTTLRILPTLLPASARKGRRLRHHWGYGADVVCHLNRFSVELLRDCKGHDAHRDLGVFGGC